MSLAIPRRFPARGTDVAALKQAHPIEAVAARYGIVLRRQGRTLVGRCPLHADKGRPNLTLFPETASWWCFRCNLGGDALRLVELVEQVGFLEAVQRLGGAAPAPYPLPALPTHPPRPTPPAVVDRDPEEMAVLRAAVLLYHGSLLAEPRALSYLVQERGIDRATIAACRVGYAPGDTLLDHLRWRRLPLGPALRLGLLTRAGRELLAGRVVVPELRAGAPVWLVGRRLDPDPLSGSATEPLEEAPKYLGLPGPRPLLGWDQARESPAVIVTEGVVDFLTLRMWGYPAVALVGTHVRPELLADLRTVRRQYLVLDTDEAGTEATLRLAQELGDTAVPVALPEDVKDVAELAARPDGQAAFAAALLEAVGARSPLEDGQS